MARGNIAKSKITKKIAEIFGQDFVGEFDKKLYIWCDDGGERVQIAISMTCPKTPVEADKIDYTAEPGDSLNFEDMSAGPIAGAAAVEVSEEEKATIAELMAKFGL